MTALTGGVSGGAQVLSYPMAVACSVLEVSLLSSRCWLSLMCSSSLCPT